MKLWWTLFVTILKLNRQLVSCYQLNKEHKTIDKIISSIGKKNDTKYCK